MADINLNTSDLLYAHEDAGQLTINGVFEDAPAFTAATTGTAVWIDGTAAGTGTATTSRWGVFSRTGSGAAQFDSANPHLGNNSMKVSTTATGSRFQVANTNSTTLANLKNYAYYVLPSTTYTVSYWMKTNLTSGVSSDGARVRVIEYNAAGTQGTVTNSTAVLTTTGWTFYTFNVTTAATAVMATLLLAVMGDTGTATLIMDAWYDEVSFQPASASGSVSLLLGPVVTPGVQDISGPKIWS